MAKKSEKKVLETKQEQVKSICQFCKSHKNGPSMCKLDGRYVARKQSACEKFKSK